MSRTGVDRKYSPWSAWNRWRRQEARLHLDGLLMRIYGAISPGYEGEGKLNETVQTSIEYLAH